MLLEEADVGEHGHAVLADAALAAGGQVGFLDPGRVTVEGLMEGLAGGRCLAGCCQHVAGFLHPLAMHRIEPPLAYFLGRRVGQFQADEWEVLLEVAEPLDHCRRRRRALRDRPQGHLDPLAEAGVDDHLLDAIGPPSGHEAGVDLDDGFASGHCLGDLQGQVVPGGPPTGPYSLFDHVPRPLELEGTEQGVIPVAAKVEPVLGEAALAVGLPADVPAVKPPRVAGRFVFSCHVRPSIMGVRACVRSGHQRGRSDTTQGPSDTVGHTFPQENWTRDRTRRRRAAFLAVGDVGLSAEMTRASGNPEALENYPQGDSNPCLSRERAMS